MLCNVTRYTVGGVSSAANAVGGAKRGPRKGGVDKEQILAAAREEFALHDYKGTTMRSVARRAGCDAKLIHYYFGSKDELFAEAISQVMESLQIAQWWISQAEEGGGGGAQVLRQLLNFVETNESGPAYVAMVRALSSEERVRQMFLDRITSRVALPTFTSLGLDQVPVRMNLITTQLLGLISVRYIMKFEPLASMSRDEVAALVGPTLDRYMSPDLFAQP